MAFSDICDPESISTIIAGVLVVIGTLAQLWKKHYRKGLSWKEVIKQINKEKNIETIVRESFSKKKKD